MEAQGYDETAIGLSGAAAGLGILCAGLLIPRVVARFGTFRVVLVSTLIAMVSLILFPHLQGAEIWFLLRFALGVGVSGLFSIGEAWINAIADEKSRGRTIAIYVAAMATSFAVGTGAVSVIGFEGWLPFVSGAIIVGVCFLPVVPFRHTDPLLDNEEPGADRNVMMQVLRLAFVLMLVVCLFGVLDGAVLALLPSYALAKGVPESQAALPLTYMAVGVVLFQAPIGYLADRMSRARLLTIILFVVGTLGLFVPQFDLNHWTGSVYLAIFGGLAFAPYTLALSLLGQRYRGLHLAAGAALFAIMWGIGGTSGPGVFGVVMETLGPDSLLYGLAIMFLAAAVISLWDRSPRADADAPSSATPPR